MLLNILILLNRIDSYQKIYLYLCPVKSESLGFRQAKTKCLPIFCVSDEHDFHNKKHSESIP